jgi:O-antigen/teichoic acid export membrane protein
MNLGRNILWNIAAFLWLSLLIVFVTPYMVGKLGLEAFGLWAVINAFGGYLTAMDFGLANALIRFVATANEQGDRNAVQAYVRSGITLQTLIGALASILLFAASNLIVHHWITTSASLHEEALLSFRLSAVAILLGFWISALSSIPAALHRFDLLATRTVVFFSVQYLMILIVLHFGRGLSEIIGIYVLVTAVTACYLAWVARRVLPGINLFPGWDSGAVINLLRFGCMKFPAQLSNTLLQQWDRIALGVRVPVDTVSYYVVPQRISQRLGQVAENIAGPFYPAVASHFVAERIEVLRNQYRQGVRFVALAVCGAIAVLGGLAVPLLSVWMGNDFAAQGAWPFRLLLVGYGASAMFTLPSVAADAAGRPGIPAAFLVTASLLHAVVLWLAIPRFGLPGAAGGVCLGFLLPLLLGVPVIHRKVPFLPPLSSVFNATFPMVLAGACTAGLSWLISLTPYPASGPVPLLGSLLTFSVIYLGLVFVLGGLRVHDFRRMALIFQSTSRGSLD